MTRSPRKEKMPYDPQKHHRRSIRLKGYDYRHPGAYFITLVTQDRACLFGEIVDGEMRLNEAGEMIQAVWDELSVFYAGVQTDAFVVMPNHMHGIIILTGQPVGAGPRTCPDEPGQPVGAGPRTCPDEPGQPQGIARTLSLPDVVHRFKTLTTKRYANGVKTLGWPPFRGRLWQRNYYEHIIRNELSLNRIRQYITENPLRWHLDRENPARTGEDPLWDEILANEKRQ